MISGNTAFKKKCCLALKLRSHCQCGHFIRNIALVTPKIVYFYDQRIYRLDRSIPKRFKLSFGKKFNAHCMQVTDSMSKVRVGKIAVQPPLPDLLFDNSRSAQCPVHLELHKGAGFDMESAGWRNNLGDERLNMVFGETMPSGLHRADSSSVMNADGENTESLT